MSAAPRITILLCTYNGARYLQAQLDSYLAQSYPHWDLWVSDDGSHDETRALLAQFGEAQKGRHKVTVIDGPKQGSTRNYLSLLCHPDLPDTGPVALSDQDDVWFPDKLARAVDGLSRGGACTAYGGQSLHTTPELKVIGRSHPPARPPSFANALTQNILSGHSLCLSAGALRLMREVGVPAQDLAYHDWFLYQLVTGAGGDVVIDPQPVLYYRQHADNVMGAHQGVRASLHRARLILSHRYGHWIANNCAALAAAGPALTSQNRQTLNRVQESSGTSPLRRSLALARAGLHRQNRRTTLFFYLAALLGRL